MVSMLQIDMMDVQFEVDQLKEMLDNQRPGFFQVSESRDIVRKYPAAAAHSLMRALLSAIALLYSMLMLCLSLLTSTSSPSPTASHHTEHDG
jgi:hypothetical protein